MSLGVVDDVQSWPCPDGRAAQPPERTGGVRVKGVGDLLIRASRKARHPIPGHPIDGVMTRGKGVTVHLQSVHRP